MKEEEKRKRERKKDNKSECAQNYPEHFYTISFTIIPFKSTLAMDNILKCKVILLNKNVKSVITFTLVHDACSILNINKTYTHIEKQR